MVSKIRAVMRKIISSPPWQNETLINNAAVCAEECSELSQACMKFVRMFQNDPSLRNNEKSVMYSLNEEVADVLICICNLEDATLINEEEVMCIVEEKCKRYENSVNVERR